MKKYLITTFALILLFNCRQSIDKNSSFEIQNIEGSWYSIQNTDYLEYYINKNYMHVFDPYANEIISYNYFVRNDSIFRYDFNLGYNIESSRYFSKILKTDSLKINLLTRTLNKTDTLNTLEMYINKEINRDTYFLHGQLRKNGNIPR